MGWADARRRLKVRTNAETPTDARTAVRFGAEGIGLCRTEHMFFAPERIIAMQEMILAEDGEGRRRALAKILPMQRDDFAELFEIMRGLPVTMRLLDPPLHEFLPHEQKDMEAVAKAANVELKAVRRRLAELQEANPMLGLRGCRLGIVYPEIYEMQARAIFEAALLVGERHGETVTAEVMIPLVGSARELEILKKRIDAVAAEVGEGEGQGARLPGRHHDRAAARGPAGRRDREAGRLLQLRHQRPHPDDARPVARRFRASSSTPTSRPTSSPPTRSRRLDQAGVGELVDDRGRARPRQRGRTSSSASAASTAATRPRSPSASAPGSTTSPARPTASRSRGSRRPRRRCGQRLPLERRRPARDPAGGRQGGAGAGAGPTGGGPDTPRRPSTCSTPPGSSRAATSSA